MEKTFKPKTEIVVMCGIPGIGKSYVVENFFPYHQRVNLDSIHDLLSPNGFEKRNLSLGRSIEDLIINERLGSNIPVIIDNTSITKDKRQKYIDFAKKYSVDIKALYFEPDSKKAISQNDKRQRKVPKVVIYKMAKEFQIPEIIEGFSEIIRVDEIGKMFGKKPGVFLDRDGVILNNKIDGKDHFVNKPSDIIFYEKSLDSLRRLSNKGYELFIVSNQGGIAYGKMTEKELEGINCHLMDVFTKNNINMKKIYCCTHSKEDHCKCRKPKTGMIVRAAYEHGINLSSSYLVGDMTTDIELGKRLSLKTVLVETGCAGLDKEYDSQPDFTAKNLYESIDVMPKLF